jgi:hypothetical protein
VSNADAGETRPWERPGAVRRDCEPGRGGWLLLLSGAALACSFSAICLAVPALVGLPLGVAVWSMAGHDLARMRAGLLDPAGRAAAEEARGQAFVAVVMALTCLVVHGLMLWQIVARP